MNFSTYRHIYSDFERGRYAATLLSIRRYLLEAAKKVEGPQELILFCTKDDATFVMGISKSLSDDQAIIPSDLRRAALCQKDVAKVPKVTLMVYERGLSCPKPRVSVEEELSIMKDMLSGLKSS
jgi:hypothetical protein